MDELFQAISRLSGMIGQMEETAKEQFGFSELTLTRMHYLETISLLDNPNTTELAEAMKLTKPTVKVAVDKLIELDYVYRIQSDEDRRSVHLHLTEKGKLINRMHEYAHRRMAEVFLRSLSEDEIRILTGLLLKVLKD